MISMPYFRDGNSSRLQKQSISFNTLIYNIAR